MKTTTLPAGRADGYKGQISKEAKPAKAAKGSITKKVRETLVTKITKTEVVTIINKDAKRAGTASGDRFASAVKFMAKNAKKKITLDVLLANSTYTLADFRHDLSKGFVAAK